MLVYVLTHSHTHTFNHTLTPVHTHTFTHADNSHPTYMLVHLHTHTHTHTPHTLAHFFHLAMSECLKFLTVCANTKAAKSIWGEGTQIFQFSVPLSAFLRSSRTLEARVDSQGEIQVQDGETDITGESWISRQGRTKEGFTKERCWVWVLRNE